MTSKLTPKGMRDFLPEEAAVREEVRNKIATIYKKYGFLPMETPALEYLETLRAKAGDEIDKQIFVLSDERLALRFDMTVPLARVASTIEAPRPFKRYAIGPVWRKEEPQKGRFREFWQADADIIGSSSMRAEAELLTMAKEICTEFGFSKPKILLNNRKILNAMAKELDFEDNKNEVFRTLDKIDKIGREEVEKEIVKLIGQRGTELIREISSGKNNEEKLAIAEKFSKEGADELREILRFCNFEIDVDLLLVRGLGYYTGPVFEIKLSDEIGTVIAGGRYDGLLSLYGRGEAATGISVGVERLITLTIERKKTKSTLQVFVANVKDEQYLYALEVASKLRNAGINCETDLNCRNLRKQLDYVNAKKIKYAVIVGEKEASRGNYKLKDMESGKEEEANIEKLINLLKEADKKC
ncbi:MAG: histidine--tRNA ligase [Candidatus Bilamarchaeaceae archaeon]